MWNIKRSTKGGNGDDVSRLPHQVLIQGGGAGRQDGATMHYSTQMDKTQYISV